MVEKQQVSEKKKRKTENPVSRGLADKRKVKSVDAIFPVEEIYTLFEKSAKKLRINDVVFDFTCFSNLQTTLSLIRKGRSTLAPRPVKRNSFV
jgi:hypothetical protein